VTITIRDVAREAGVSTATVSRALRGLGNVDPLTREHIQRVADRLDYIISPTASRLAGGRAGTVAVLSPHISKWYFATALAGVERAMSEADVDLLVHTVGDAPLPSPSLAERRMRSRVDGVLVLGTLAASPDVSALVGRRFPMVLVGARRDDVSSVAIDDVEGARMATQHLVNLGHKRIGLIDGRAGLEPVQPEDDRRRGYVEVLESAGLCVESRLRVPGNFTTAGGEDAMNTLLAASSPPTAVFALSDQMAYGAMRALRRHGVRPGHDVALVGFDGHDMADMMELTTVSQPVEDLGEQGARDLLALLADPDCGLVERTLPVALQVRASSAPPPLV
jgi:DNA-binding LacI/PurR family transcriptional regulator